MNPLKPALLASASLLLSSWSAQAVVLFDNLSGVEIGSEPADVTTWQAQQFLTDASPYTLESVTLFIGEDTAGGAQVDIYSGSAEPTTLLGTLTSPGSYSPTLASTVFTTPGISLAPNAEYWVVLKGVGAGAYSWGYSDSSEGSGPGFSPFWTQTSDAGANWMPPSEVGPYQMSVSATAVPEPGAWAAATVVLLGGFAAMRRWRQRNARVS